MREDFLVTVVFLDGLALALVVEEEGTGGSLSSEASDSDEFS